MDAFIQVEVDQSFEKSTQTLKIKCDASTEVEQSLLDAKSTQTVSEIMRDKNVQTFWSTSDNKETQACASIRKSENCNHSTFIQIDWTFQERNTKTNNSTDNRFSQIR
ncbi:hypothetical protein AVEN_6765-1 [Araneus ventricosus]|uniref:Uncharacterized protein n=1 Tax=Araneus ventricosus TaxID=182803 RepID=A0A4Y2GTH7_ARAVE|nr:hypothetical protein AVEN_6765-1 [Araneus ventricosus]